MVLKRRYKGNTLPEVLIAIVIISFTSVMGMGIYVNVQENTQPFIKLKAAELAARYLQQTEAQHAYLDQQFSEETFSIKRSISHAERYPDCVIITISVSHQSEKKICELQKIVYGN